MNKHFPTSWCFVPLFLTDYHSLHRIEQKWIRRLKPPLNYKTSKMRNYKQEPKPSIKALRRTLQSKKIKKNLHKITNNTDNRRLPRFSKYFIPPQTDITRYTLGDRTFHCLHQLIQYIQKGDQLITKDVKIIRYKKQHDFSNFTSIKRHYGKSNVTLDFTPECLIKINPSTLLHRNITKIFEVGRHQDKLEKIEGTITSFRQHNNQIIYTITHKDKDVEEMTITETLATLNKPFAPNYTVTLSFKRFLTFIKTFSGPFTIHEITSFNKKTRQGLYWLAHNKARAKNFFKKLTPEELITFFIICKKLPVPKLRLNIRGWIKYFLRHKYKCMPPTKQLTIKIPYNTYRKKQLKLFTKHMISSTKLPKYLQRFIYYQTRIVFTKRTSTASHILNHIKQAKHFTTKPPLCTCSNIKKCLREKQVINLSQLKSNHFALHTRNISPHLRFLKTSILNIPSPSRINTLHELTSAFKSYHNQLLKFNILKSDGNQHRPSYKDFHHKQIQLIKWDIKQHKPQHHIPNIKQIYRLKQQLGNSTIGYLDKEDGLPFIACPRWYWSTIKETFFNDTEHYEHTTKTNLTVIKKFKNFAKRHSYDKLLCLSNTKNSSPYCYTLPKAKDFNRFRPIVSYFHHPLKKLYNYASRALTFILKHSKTNSFTLWNTKDLLPTITHISNTLKHTYGKNTKLLSYCADIKNMYTSLPHDTIIESIKSAIALFTKTKMGRRCRSGISIERHAHGCVRPGRIQNSSYVTLKLEDIIRICTFDIKNAYFLCLGKILHQTVGVPMGSPGSPAYAICICMHYEHDFNKKTTHLQRILHPRHPQRSLCMGLRYIDDLAAFFPYEKNDPISYTIALLLKDYLSKNTYHPNMLLKDEPITNNSFDFLETTIKYTGKTKFDIKHKDKNIDSLLKHNKLKKIKSIHASSFGPKQQPIDIVLNTLHRINTNCSNDYLKIHATLEHIYVARHFGYKNRHFKKALTRMSITTTNPLWHTLIKTLQTTHE